MYCTGTSRKIMPPLMFPPFPRKQKSAELKFVFVTKKKAESTILQMESGSSLSVIPAVPVQYMPNVEASDLAFLYLSLQATTQKTIREAAALPRRLLRHKKRSMRLLHHRRGCYDTKNDP